MLEWIGDIGGLYDGLKVIFSILVGPASAFAMSSKLLTSLFSFIPSRENVALDSNNHIKNSKELIASTPDDAERRATL